jgi:predicted DNA-binding transcriptional regulator AlpA
MMILCEDTRELPPDLLADRVIGTNQAAAYCGFSTVHWRALVNSGEAPAPLRLSARKLGWRVSTLRAWIDAKASAAA